MKPLSLKAALFVIVTSLSLLYLQRSAEARVNVRIDLSSQRMYVTSSQGSYVWPVSTARSGYTTPRGTYAPQHLARMHYSRKYHMSPMPHAIFFRGGYAIHGTGSVSQLGRPASHGCVRLAPGAAARLYQMVQSEGASITITGASPASTRFAKRSNGHGSRYAARKASAAYAYAPTRRAYGIRRWQANPARW